MRLKNILIYIFVVCLFGFMLGEDKSKTYLKHDGIYYDVYVSDIWCPSVNKPDNKNNYGVKIEETEANKTSAQYYIDKIF